MDDAPQISTLKEDDSPSPQTVKVPGGIKSIKLVLKDQPSQHPFDILASTAAQSAALPTHVPQQNDSQNRKRRLSQIDDEEEEPEEDQLIDDDDDQPLTMTPKKRSPSKPKKEKEKKDKVTKVTKLTLQLGAPPSTATSSIAASTDKADSVEPPTKKKRTAPKKSRTVSTSKVKIQAGRLKLLPPQEDVASVVSEAYTGTAASSPGNTHYEPNSPIPDDFQMSLPPPALPVLDPPFTAHSEETGSQLEGIAVPSYPLPTKPFPVMPPPKIASGMAPTVVFDKSHKKVRHWRTALREIKGIAGGRWFAQTWVGHKESQFASTIAASKGNPDNISVASASASPEKGSGLSKLAAAASLSTQSSTSTSNTPAAAASSTSVFSVVPQPSSAMAK